MIIYAIDAGCVEEVEAYRRDRKNFVYADHRWIAPGNWFSERDHAEQALVKKQQIRCSLLHKQQQYVQRKAARKRVDLSDILGM